MTTYYSVKQLSYEHTFHIRSIDKESFNIIESEEQSMGLFLTKEEAFADYKSAFQEAQVKLNIIRTAIENIQESLGFEIDFECSAGNFMHDYLTIRVYIRNYVFYFSRYNEE